MRSRLRAWARHPGVLVGLDVAAAAGLLVIAASEITGKPVDGYHGGRLWVNALLALLTILPVPFRRAFPREAFAVAAGSQLVADLLVTHSSFFWSTGIPLSMLLYSVARTYSSRWVYLATALVPLGLIGEALHLADARDPVGWLSIVILCVAITSGGTMMRRNAESSEALREALAELRADQSRRERAAAASERRRIRSEVDDVLTHVMGQMIVQVGAVRVGLEAAGHVVPSQLLAAEETGRRALSEVATSLSVGKDRAPLPSLEDLPALVERFRSSGVPLEARLEPPTGLAPNLQVSAYRVVQEGLTNVLKHNGRVPTVVVVDEHDGHLQVSVGNVTAVAPGPQLPSGGHGLPGLRVRASVFGGSVTAGPTASGYEMRARFPLGSDALPEPV